MRLRKSVGQAVNQLASAEIGTIGALVQAVSAYYGKPIALEALEPGEWGPLTAFLEEDDDQVTIYYRSEDSPQYRLQCICHELGHLMMGTACSLPIDEAVTSQVEVSEGVIRVQARDLRDTPEEAAAEEFAFVVIRLLRVAAQPRSLMAEIFAL